jgi:hypothetical protein
MKRYSMTLSLLLATALMLPAFQALAANAVAPTDEGTGADPAATSVLGGRSCGTPDVSPAQADAARGIVRAQRLRSRDGRTVGGTIDVAFHNILGHGEGFVSRRTFVEQIQVMNERYAGSGFTFRLRSIDRIDRQPWFNMLPGNGAEKQAKMALAIDPAHTLNVYTCSPGQGLLGWAYFPFTPGLTEDSFYHGVVIHYGSLPDGFIPNYNLGLTLVHETGHYLGLFHTFQGGCVAPGDYIDDTPFEASPAFGCPIGRNTCEEPGDDPIHNYMDYTYDDCYTEFTPLQIAWTQAIVPVYRPSLLHRDEDEQAIVKPGAGEALAVPAAGALEFRGAFPNPFSREATLRYSLPSHQHVSLSVYNVAGQRVASLVDGEEDAGEHFVSFAPRGSAAGMYFVVLRSGGQMLSRSAVFIP